MHFHSIYTLACGELQSITKLSCDIIDCEKGNGVGANVVLSPVLV